MNPFISSLVNPLQQYLRLKQRGMAPDYDIHSSVDDVNTQIQDSAANSSGMYSNDAESAYEKYLQQFPEHPTSYSPWRKFGAVLAGMASNNPVQTSSDVLNYHYNQAVKDWTAKAPWLERAADNERQMNNVNRQIDYNRGQLRVADRRAAATEQRNADLYETSQRKQDLDERKYELALFKQNHPNYQLKTDKDGMIVGINPQNPTDVVPSRVRSNELTAMEKRQFQLDLIEARKDASIAVKTTPSAAQTAKGMSPTQKAAEENRRAREALSKHPEWEAYMVFDTNGKFLRTTLPRESTSMIGTKKGVKGDPKVLDQVNNYIYQQDLTSAAHGGWTITEIKKGGE